MNTALPGTQLIMCPNRYLIRAFPEALFRCYFGHYVWLSVVTCQQGPSLLVVEKNIGYWFQFLYIHEHAYWLASGKLLAITPN